MHITSGRPYSLGEAEKVARILVESPNLVGFTGKFTGVFTDITSTFTTILGLD